MRIDELRDQIAHRRDLGSRLGELQRTVIEPATQLSEEEQAALWLYARSYRGADTRSAHRAPQVIAR